MARLHKAGRLNPPRIRPQIMLLEDRCVPAVIYPINNPDYDPNSILVKFTSSAEADAFKLANAATTLSVSSEVADLLVPGLRTITFDGSSVNVTQMMSYMAAQPGVSFVEANYFMHTAATTPNDTSFTNLWGMNNTGQVIGGQTGIADADIDAPEAWDLSRGSGNFVIAVIDTGVDWAHPDLAANIWTNPGEIAGDGIDNDGNGRIDDIRGWDFVNNDNNPTDDNGHGTHCAGTIGGVGNNGLGVAGVNWNVKIMPLKFLSGSGSGSTANALSCLNYAVAKGARVSSNSWGGGGFSNSFLTALQNAATQGHLFISAAGNAGANNDVTPFYPANYNSPNVVSVAATDNRDALAGFSCYGATTVDLAAPGVNIYSTRPGNQYQYLSGTSMATPHVAGAAALVWDYYPTFTYSDIMRRMYATVDKIGSLNGKVATGGRLNLFKALRNTAPSTQPDFFNMNQGQTLNIPVNSGLLSNDTDAEADPMTAQLVSAPSTGTLTLNANGSFVYTPPVLFSGVVTFTYLAKDFGLSSAPTTVTINIAQTNVAPVALNDGVYLTPPGQTLNISSPGVLTNDYDPDGNFANLTAIKMSNPNQGTVTLNANGSFVYTPNANASGFDSFTYVANDGALNSNLATVTIRINSLPVVSNSSWLTKQLTLLTGNVLTNLSSDPDSDPLTAQLVAGPSNGIFSLAPNGDFSYTPNAGFGGLDTFTFVANDGWENSATATVTIRVDRLPVANGDSFTMKKNSVLEVFAPGILANDVDDDIPTFPDVLKAKLVTGVSNGTLLFDANGYIRYTPNTDFIGNDSFTYLINDGMYDGNTTTVKIEVKGTPTAINDNYSMFGTTLDVPSASGVLINDSSPNMAPLTARLVSTPANGQVTLNPDGSFTYQTFNGFNGVDWFTYVANDGLYDSDPATVFISVFNLNRPPVANNDSYTMPVGTTLSIPAAGVLENDVDPENDPLVATMVSGTRYGNLVLNFDGSFVYTPMSGFHGVDSFTYQASDGHLLSNIATVEIVVGSRPALTSPDHRVILGKESGGELKVFAGETGELVFTITPYATFKGGIRVATGDVNGDGVPDIITAPSAQSNKAGNLPVRVFSGVDGNPLPGVLGTGVYPFNTTSKTYLGGVQVAAGDVNSDGLADIVVSADSSPGAGIPWVRTVNATTGTVFSNWVGGFSPYSGSTFGGVRVAVGDVNGDGRADIITAPVGGTTSAQGTQTIKVYNPAASSAAAGLFRSFNAYSTNVSGGVFVAVGDLNGDGKAEIVTGAATNTNGHVRVFDGGTGSLLKNFSVAGSTSGPARVAVGDVNGDGKLDLIVGITTPGAFSKARVYDYATLNEMLTSTISYGDGYSSGLFTAALSRNSLSSRSSSR